MGLSEENVGKLENNAAKRKERLAALKKKKFASSSEVNDGNEDLPASQVLFRNYQPENEKLEENILEPVAPSDIESLVEDQLKSAENNEQIAEVEISNLAPKKLTFDLRRAIEPQLQRLERKTDKAIAELIRERLQSGKQLDFVLPAKLQQKEIYESDED